MRCPPCTFEWIVCFQSHTCLPLEILEIDQHYSLITKTLIPLFYLLKLSNVLFLFIGDQCIGTEECTKKTEEKETLLTEVSKLETVRRV